MRLWRDEMKLRWDERRCVTEHANKLLMWLVNI
jgi:hypothetical protein